MSLIGRILNVLSDKGFPLSDTYLTLWCWVFDEAFLEIRNPREFAFESGFGGPRAEATWSGRMKRLEELGFIHSKPGPSGDFAYVLLLNPIQVIDEIYKTRPHDHYYTAMISRLIQIGADDLDPAAEDLTASATTGSVSSGTTIPSPAALAGLPPFGPLPPAVAATPPTPETPSPPSGYYGVFSSPSVNSVISAPALSGPISPAPSEALDIPHPFKKTPAAES